MNKICVTIKCYMNENASLNTHKPLFYERMWKNLLCSIVNVKKKETFV